MKIQVEKHGMQYQVMMSQGERSWLGFYLPKDFKMLRESAANLLGCAPDRGRIEIEYGRCIMPGEMAELESSLFGDTAPDVKPRKKRISGLYKSLLQIF